MKQGSPEHLRMKKLNYQLGAAKRLTKTKGETQPGELISKSKPVATRERVAIMGLV